MKKLLVCVVVLSAFVVGSVTSAWSYTYVDRFNRAVAIEGGGNGSFMSTKGNHSGIDNTFNWSSDGCSDPWFARIVIPVAIGHTVFDSQCQQHDFGWRNFGPHGGNLSSYESTRVWTNNIFRNNMYNRCGVWWIRYAGQEAPCDFTADLFYSAVQLASW